MKKILLTCLFLTAIAQANPEGYVWEFERYAPEINSTAIGKLDLKTPNVMISHVTCYAHDNGEVARVQAEGLVRYSGNKIINNGSNTVEEKVPFNNGDCIASIPAGQVMTYSVIDENHLAVTIPFYPNPIIWTKVK